MLPAFSIVGLLLAAGETMGWTASWQTLARGRTEPAADESAALGELELGAQLGLSAHGAWGTATLTYSPRLLLHEVVSGSPAEAGNATRQGGRLELEARLGPTTRLTSRSLVEWGLTDFSPLSSAGVAGAPADPGTVGTPAGIARLPSQRFVHTLQLESTLGVTHRFSRRLQVSLAAGAVRSGGIGHDGVQAVPIQVGPQARAALAFITDPSGSNFVLSATTSQSRFSTGRDSLLSNLQAGWALRSSREMLLDAAAGAGWVRSYGEGGATQAMYPAAGLGATWEPALARQRALHLSLRFNLVPGVDRFTALATETLRVDQAVELSDSRLRVGLVAWEVRAVSGVSPAGEVRWSLSGGAEELHVLARSSWAAAEEWSIQGELGAAWTNQVPFAGWQGLASVGLRWTGMGWF